MNNESKVATWVWALPVLVPITGPFVALHVWVKRDLTAGFAAVAASVVGYIVWALVVLIVIMGIAQSGSTY